MILKAKYYISLCSEGLLNSYSQIFFSNNKVLAYILLAVSFFDLGAGMSGVIAVLIGQLTAVVFSYNHESIRNGLFTYNSLMVGLAIGVFYDFNLSFFILLVVTSFFTVFLTLWFCVSLAKRQLPFLSIPFLLAIWAIILGADNFTALALKEKEELLLIRYFPELFSSVTNFVESLPFANAIHLYLRSLGAIFFQFNDLAGLLIAIGILIYSRIGFSLTIFGFLIGYLFYFYLEGDFSQLIYSYIGFNFILTAIALGGFYVVPSRSSYGLLVLTIPVIALLISALHSLFIQFNLPLYSLPFNIVVLLFLAAMAVRAKASHLHLVTLQQFSPEKNHYKFTNSVERFSKDTHFHIGLPVMGEWTISQDNEGEITHIGEWAQALDFVIRDDHSESYRAPGYDLKDYYCYDLPVVAPANGWVVKVLDGIKDNKITEVDLENNWGNTIIIKHGEYLYSKLCHLKMNTIKFKVGEYVKKGDVVANCGSSGRSPEPHLHFQLQTTPYIGSKTLEHPISYYLTKEGSNYTFNSFETPKLNQTVCNVKTTKLLKDAFGFIPGKKIRFEVEGRSKRKEITEWEVFTNAYNKTYIYCHKTKAVAYFVNNGTVFYFTDFYGSKTSLLHLFYMSAHKVLLGYYEGISLRDKLMIQNIFSPFTKFLHDFAAPFYHFCKVDYAFRFTSVENEHKPTKIECSTVVTGSIFGKRKRSQKTDFVLEEGTISHMKFESKNKTIHARCINS
ncbi:MAG: peptidoglycan DD-metalloendopeptidase family protein [Bacteroidetes bacterium]|nr:peptidoglycan DD-metalloendopeptidase family protein [Bacteroidota bacterium]